MVRMPVNRSLVTGESLRFDLVGSASAVPTISMTATVELDEQKYC